MQKNYESLKIEYLKQIQNKSIPLKITQKLQLLFSLIHANNINLENIIDIPLKEVNRITQLSHQEQLSLAIQLMTKALKSNTYVQLDFPQTSCLIKKQGFFNQWFTTFIHYHHKKLLFTILVNGHQGKHLYQFNISQITLSDQFKKFKNRKGFIITSNSKQYSIAFNHQSTCQKTYARLLKLIQKQNASTEIDKQSLSSIPLNQIVQSSSGSQSQRWSRMVPFEQQTIKAKQLSQKQQQFSISSDLQACDKKYKKQTYAIIQSIRQKLDDQESFKLLKNFKNGQILINKQNKNQIKVLLLLKCQSLSQIVQLYSDEKKWNSQIEIENILAKTQQNGYIIDKKIKSNSKIFWPLQCIIQRKVVAFAGNVYIIDQGIQSQMYQYSYVKAKMSKIIQIAPRNPNQWIMVTICQINSQSYFNKINSFDILFKYLQSLQHFQTYIDSKTTRRPLLKKKPLFSFEIYDNSVNQIQTESLTKSTHSLPPKNLPFKQQSVNALKHNKSQIFLQNVKNKPQKDFIHKQKSTNFKENTFKISQLVNGFSQQSQEQNEKQKYKNFQKISLSNQYTTVEKSYFEQIDKQTHLKYYLKKKFSQSQLQGNIFPRYQPGFIFQTQQWIINKQRQMIYVNKRLLDAQKGVISFIIKQIGSNIFSGKSIMNMSLPVQIFSKESFLEFIANSFGFAPTYFSQAAKIFDPIQQMKLVTLFMVNSPTLSFKIEKPFNPILGQTFTGYLGGIPIYFQQISHHPPISAFYMVNQQYKFYGQSKMSANMGLNSAIGMNLSFLNVQFLNTGCHFKIYEPEVEVSGLIYGDRKFKLIGKGIVTQQKNNLYSQIQFGDNKNNNYEMKYVNRKQLKGCSVNGIICKVKNGFYQNFNKMIEKQKKSKYLNIKGNQIEEKLVQVHGQYTKNMYFDEKEVKNENNDLPYKCEYYQTPLPSDCNFRKDILYRRNNDNVSSQQQKEILQNNQRHDKKLRQSYKNKK